MHPHMMAISDWIENKRLKFTGIMAVPATGSAIEAKQQKGHAKTAESK